MNCSHCGGLMYVDTEKELIVERCILCSRKVDTGLVVIRLKKGRRKVLVEAAGGGKEVLQKILDYSPQATI